MYNLLLLFSLYLKPKHMSAEQEANRLLKLALDNIKDDDYAHRGFLKPIEIALKTYHTEMMSDGLDD